MLRTQSKNEVPRACIRTRFYMECDVMHSRSFLHPWLWNRATRLRGPLELLYYCCAGVRCSPGLNLWEPRELHHRGTHSPGMASGYQLSYRWTFRVLPSQDWRAGSYHLSHHHWHLDCLQLQLYQRRYQR